ncbi:hypothetical protein E4U92_26350 [Streptomyces galbus]|uniref:Uncharacterized protein n=1 Tax=Streptomyces galbus TaxID=33898 RepID=A0A4U5WWE8_STRGB|nr:hypothetical protein E4U92_26350 [Streptomyces galbus]
MVAQIAVVLDHTTAGALYEPKDPFNEAVAAFYVQASGGLGDLYAPVLSLTAGDAGRPGLLADRAPGARGEVEPHDRHDVPPEGGGSRRARGEAPADGGRAVRQRRHRRGPGRRR